MCDSQHPPPALNLATTCQEAWPKGSNKAHYWMSQGWRWDIRDGEELSALWVLSWRASGALGPAVWWWMDGAAGPAAPTAKPQHCELLPTSTRRGSPAGCLAVSFFFFSLLLQKIPIPSNNPAKSRKKKKYKRVIAFSSRPRPSHTQGLKAH